MVPGARLARCSHGPGTPRITFCIEVEAYNWQATFAAGAGLLGAKGHRKLGLHAQAKAGGRNTTEG